MIQYVNDSDFRQISTMSANEHFTDTFSFLPLKVLVLLTRGNTPLWCMDEMRSNLFWPIRHEGKRVAFQSKYQNAQIFAVGIQLRKSQQKMARY